MLSCYLERFACMQMHNVRTTSNVLQLKTYATQTEFKINKETETADISPENARPCNEIPQPKKFTLFKNFLPGGIYHDMSTTDMVMDLYNKYGQIFRMPGFFGKPDIVVTMNPNDFPVVFRHEGIWPERRNFDTLLYHRRVHRSEFFQGLDGITSASGEKWAEMRTAVNPILMQPKNSILYLKTMLEVNDEFLQRIREIRDPATNEVPDTFEDDINRLTLESVAAVALNTQLGLIRKNRNSAESKTIISSVRKFFDLAFHLEMLPPFWKFIKTPKFREMMKTLDTLTDVSNKYISEALVRIEHNEHGDVTSEVGKEKSVLEKLLRINKRFAIVMALDLMMAGVDTTSTALTGILFCIAKNPQKQEKLLKEIRQALPHKNSHFTIEGMRNLPYLRACIKEGMRYYPVLPGTMRTMPVDVVLSGYRVPKGTEVSMGGNLLMRNEKFVPRASEYLPERWLRNNTDSQYAGEVVNPFLNLPFGFGPRSCVGRRIVDMELEIAVGRLVRNFNIEFNHPLDKPFKAKFINIPAIPLEFKFEERPN